MKIPPVKACRIQSHIPHKQFQKIPTVRSPSAALALQHIFGSTRDREFPIANSGSILTHKASTPTRHAMDDSPRFVHRLALLQRWLDVTQLRQVDPAWRVKFFSVTRCTIDSKHANRPAPSSFVSALPYRDPSRRSLLVTCRINSSCQLRHATPLPQHSTILGIGG